VRAVECEFQALAGARSEAFRLLVLRSGARIQPDQNPLMSGLNFGEIHLPANSLKDSAARMAGGGEGNIDGTRSVVDLAIGAADHDYVSIGLPAHLGLQVVLARRENLASHCEGERNLEGKLGTGADWDGHGWRRKSLRKHQSILDCILHKASCEQRREFDFLRDFGCYECNRHGALCPKRAEGAMLGG
jgi:hypothetical protein